MREFGPECYPWRYPRQAREALTNPPPVWVVNLIYPDDVGIPYVGLINLADPQDKKTLSISALLDKTRNRLVVDMGAAA